MNLLSLPYELQQLSRLGMATFEQDTGWADYLLLGITPEHIPALITIIEEIDDFPFCEDDDPCSWMPMHAWRALAELQAETALPAMIKLLNLVDDDEDEIVQLDLPIALSRMCPAAVPLLIQFINDPLNGTWARLGAAEALQIAALDKPNLRSEIVTCLSTALTESANGDKTYNSVLVEILTKLRAAEAASQVERAFTAGKIDETICGDWEDFQVGVGLLGERLTEPAHQTLSPISFLDGNDLPLHSGLNAPLETKEDRKTRKNRKRDVVSGKTNRKMKN